MEFWIKIPDFSSYFAVNSGLKLIWSELLNIVNNPNSHTNEIYNENHHQRRDNAELENSTSESCETYLMQVLTNPLSLKQQARIVIRNCLIENMKHQQFVREFVLSNPKYQLNSALYNNSQNLSTKTTTTVLHRMPRQRTSSILECLIWQLDIPRILHFYLYAFPDVPAMRCDDDIAVFVND